MGSPSRPRRNRTAPARGIAACRYRLSPSSICESRCLWRASSTPGTSSWSIRSGTGTGAASTVPNHGSRRRTACWWESRFSASRHQTTPRRRFWSPCSVAFRRASCTSARLCSAWCRSTSSDSRRFSRISICSPAGRTSFRIRYSHLRATARYTGPRARLLEVKHPGNINPPHALLEIESQDEVVHQLLALMPQVWNFHGRVSWARHCVVGGELDLVFTQHLSLHNEALRCQRVVIVSFVPVHWVVIACFSEVPHRLLLGLCQPIDMPCLRCSHPLEPSDRHWLAHCPHGEVVRLELEDV